MSSRSTWNPVATLVLLSVLAFVVHVRAFPPSDPKDPLSWHVSAERAEEVSITACGGLLKSTGRILNCGQTSSDISDWSKSPTPTRTFDYFNHHFNSDKWDAVKLNKDDVIIGTIGKSGTTWMQGIIGFLMMNKGLWPSLGEGEALFQRMPWVDMRIPPPHVTAGMVNAQTYRKVLKTHLPLDGIAYNPDVKYVYVVRDPRDVAVSLINHWCSFSPTFFAIAASDVFIKGEPMPKCEDRDKVDVRAFIKGLVSETLEGNSWIWSYWHNIATWWAYRRLPNVLLVHYENLKTDPASEISRIANFLDIVVDAKDVARVIEQTSMENMRKPGVLPDMSAFFEGGANSFIHKGENKRWKDALTEEDNAWIQKIGKEKLGEVCWHWVETGKVIARPADEL